jgi:triosephosphate isomerase
MMEEKERFFVNLKRFDIPSTFGGICPQKNSFDWIYQQLTVIEESIRADFKFPKMVFLLPESLLPTAVSSFPSIPFGCQSIIHEDVEAGKNIGAFTGMRTAKSMKAIGCSWTMIGHSEERKYLKDILVDYNKIIELADNDTFFEKFVGQRLNKQIKMGLKAGLNTLLCVGESLVQRGEGEASPEIFSRVEKIISSQLESALVGLNPEDISSQLFVAYEPIWAIGPGRTPPDKSYINEVAQIIHFWFKKNFSIEINVLYGGGLKQENSFEISSVDTINGGLVALTRFSGDVGFNAEEFIEIVKKSNWYN